MVDMGESQVGDWRAGSTNVGSQPSVSDTENATTTSFQGSTAFQHDSTSASEAASAASYTNPATQPLLAPKVNLGDRTPPPETKYLNEVLRDQAYTKEVFAQINSLNVSDSDKEMMRFAYLNQLENVEPRIRQSVENAAKQALNKMRSENQVPPNWQPDEPDPRVFQSIHNKAVQKALQKAKQQLESKGQKLTDKQLSDLEYAFYHPDKASSASKKQLAALGFSGLLEQALGENDPAIDTPAGWKPDSSQYDSYLIAKGDTSFERSLFNYANAHNLSERDQNLIQSLYYHPDPAKAIWLQEAFLEIMKSVLGDMPEGWTPTPDREFFDAMVTANLKFDNGQALEKYVKDHGLNVQQTLQLRTAMQNPGDASIPYEMRLVAQSILVGPRENIIKKYGLPADWQTVGDVLPKPGDDIKAGMLQTLDDIHNILDSYVSSMPDSPERMVFKTFLFSVAAALQALKESIYRAEAEKTAHSADMSIAQKELMDFKVEQRQKQLEEEQAKQREIAASQEKAAKWGNIIQIVSIVATVVAVFATIASLGTLGPVGIAIVLAMTTLTVYDQIAGPEDAISGKVYNVVGNVAKELGADEKTAKWLDFTAKLLILAAASYYCFKNNIDIAYYLIAPQFIMNSGMVMDACAAEGVDEQTAMIISMSIGAACMLAGGVAIYRTPGAAGTFGKLANYLANVAMVSTTTAKALEIPKAYAEADEYNAKALLAQIKAAYAARDAKIQDLIDSLRAMISQLEKLLQALVSWLADVGKLQSEVWQKNATPYQSM